MRGGLGPGDRAELSDNSVMLGLLPVLDTHQKVCCLAEWCIGSLDQSDNYAIEGILSLLIYLSVGFETPYWQSPDASAHKE